MSRRPNVVVIVSDDQGYGDMSCAGGDFATPHLDRLAASGARCTSWYSNSPVCSPSRAALLTGRYPARAGVRTILTGHRHTTGLPQGIPTIATALGDLGYRSAMFGKWHLGLEEGSRPQDHGFGDWFGFMAGCIDYYSHTFYWVQQGWMPVHDLWENGTEVFHNGRYFTELVTERAVGYVRDRSRDGDPFFMYVPYNNPHYPMHAPSEYFDRFRGMPLARRMTAAMVSAMDDGIGEVIDELERKSMIEDTIVVFASDNGPSREKRNWLDGTQGWFPGGSAGPFRGEKFSLFDGGLRVPAIVSWPARIPAGEIVDETIATMDVFPTVVRAAGGDPDAFDIDGRDVLPTLADGAPTPHDRIFWEMAGQTAVRQGDWKLVMDGALAENEPPVAPLHLSNLDSDPGETTNLAADHPGLTSELADAARAWRIEVGA